MIQIQKVKTAFLLALLITAGVAQAFAGTTSAGTVTFKDSGLGKTAYRMGIPQLIKMPFKIFVKAGDSLENTRPGYFSSEDPVAGDPYNLDAETTG